MNTKKINKEDYKIFIQFDKNNNLFWNIEYKGDPYGPCTREEWHLVLDAVTQIKEKVSKYILDYEHEEDVPAKQLSQSKVTKISDQDIDDCKEVIINTLKSMFEDGEKLLEKLKCWEDEKDKH